jgi:hypothetical protein
MMIVAGVVFCLSLSLSLFHLTDGRRKFCFCFSIDKYFLRYPSRTYNG